METQNNLEIGIGTKETEALKPATVEIKEVRIDSVGTKANKKVVCSCKHPDREETIDISSMKYEKNKKLVESGLWLNLDEDEKVRKGSALAVLMEKVNATVIKELVSKSCETIQDDKGYLTFKAY